MFLGSNPREGTNFEDTTMTYEEFKQQKVAIQAAFEEAIYLTLVKMGPDIQGITWFSSKAKEYVKGSNNSRV